MAMSFYKLYLKIPHYTVYFSDSLLLSPKIIPHALHQSICLLRQRAITVI